jgi:hypothetical protein
MVIIFMLNSSTVLLDVLYCKGSLLQHTNDKELSFIGEYIVRFVSSLFETLETNNFSLCAPESPVELQKNNPKLMTGLIIGLGLFAQTMKKNPRLTYTVAGTTAVFSFLSDCAKF